MTQDADQSTNPAEVTIETVNEIDPGMDGSLTEQAQMERAINFLENEKHDVEHYELMLKFVRKLLSNHCNKKLDHYLESILSDNCVGPWFFDVLAKYVMISEPIQSIIYELSWSLCNIAACNSEKVLNSLTNYSHHVDGVKVYIFVDYMGKLLFNESGRF